MALQSRVLFGSDNRQSGLLPRIAISVTFFPCCPLELKIKKLMNPLPIDEHSSDAPLPRISSAPGPGWPAQPGLHQHRRGDILDASLRALDQHKASAGTRPALKMVEFSVELPDAQTVQLAADFTDWDLFPLDMIRFEGGIWSLTVPLPPGIYAYNFLIDGKWCDDPRIVRAVPNRPGPARAFVKVK
jgi:hypothetical protein